MYVSLFSQIIYVKYDIEIKQTYFITLYRSTIMQLEINTIMIYSAQDTLKIKLCIFAYYIIYILLIELNLW